MNPPHAIAVGLVQTVLLTIFAAGWWLRIQLPMVLGLRTDPMPDLAVVPGSPRDYTSHPSTAALVVEVADTTLHFDTNDKRLLYAEARIPEYWVLDLNARELLVFRDPNGTDYNTRQVFGPADAVSPLAAPTATVQVADLLP
jgi:Uma2 family endonuclease